MVARILAYLYAALFAFSTFYEKFDRKGMPLWLFLLNLLAAVLIALNQVSIYFLIAGLVLALGTAVLNGMLVIGQVHPSHFLIRLIISLVIFLLAVRKI